MLTLAIRARDHLPNHGSSEPDLRARALDACLQGLSEASRRVYRARILNYLEWSRGTELSRESVRAWLRSLELEGASAQVRNQALAAIKRFAAEAAELGWLAHEDAAQIARVRSKRITGSRTGIWLEPAQLRALLELPDRTTAAGRRDACALALLVGCGLRRAELCALETEQVWQLSGGRLMLRDIAGKGNRVRSVAVPQWAERDIIAWIEDTKGTK